MPHEKSKGLNRPILTFCDCGSEYCPGCDEQSEREPVILGQYDPYQQALIMGHSREVPR